MEDHDHSPMDEVKTVDSTFAGVDDTAVQVGEQPGLEAPVAVAQPRATVWCVECEDVAASVFCENCKDHFCGLCYQWQHRSGNRASHSSKPLPGMEMFREKAEEGTTAHFMKMCKSSPAKPGITGSQSEEDLSKTEDSEPADEGKDLGVNGLAKSHPGDSAHAGSAAMARIADRAKWIPMRLRAEERVLLKLLEGGLEVSEYTDNVDVVRGYSWRTSKGEVIQQELDDVFRLLGGLLVAGDFKAGTGLLKARDAEGNAEFFQQVLEVGRRYKITNPEKMRATYGKLIFLMQDAAAELPFSIRKDIVTVHGFLEERGALGLLADPAFAAASDPVDPTLPRARIDEAARRRAAALADLCRRHAGGAEGGGGGLTAGEVEACVQSFGDLHAYVGANQRPIDGMIRLLEENFNPQAAEAGYSLELRDGVGGAKLSHSHATQYKFVLQSLSLWREVVHNMFHLYILAERDLLSKDSPYRLMNTGQGMNRVQSAPRIGRAMHDILSRVQARVGSWVGLSVVHLGDRDVPNALVFIDKYTQIARILDPIVRTVDALPGLAEDPRTARVIKRLGGPDHIRKVILCDFFKHGFDGSGSDGGSCIDGRLTSAWNWCSRLEKKQYHSIFMLAGFQGFDGDFRK